MYFSYGSRVHHGEGEAWQLEKLKGKNNPGSRARVNNLKTLPSDTLFGDAMLHYPISTPTGNQVLKYLGL